jgi:hypothetical protein
MRRLTLKSDWDAQLSRTLLLQAASLPKHGEISFMLRRFVNQKVTAVYRLVGGLSTTIQCWSGPGSSTIRFPSAR